MDIAPSNIKTYLYFDELLDRSLSLKPTSRQKQSSIGAIMKICSENFQQIYRRTPMLKCGINKVAKQLY